MSVKRRAGGPIRQLSLQQSTRRPLKKQVSEDSSRPQVHGRAFKWDNQSDTGLTVLANSITSSGTTVTQERKQSAKPRETQLSLVRPRPVKIAWSERRQLSQEGDNSGVEVVAQRCKGQPRPVTAKPTRNNGLSCQNDSIVYSREQLAARLRVAWRQRQESRPNLDIFLAHNSSDQGLNDDDVITSARDCASSISCSSLSTSSKQNDDQQAISPRRSAVQVNFPVVSFTKDSKLLNINDTSKHLLFNNAPNNERDLRYSELSNELDEKINDIFVQKDLNLLDVERPMHFNFENHAVPAKTLSEITISITPEDNDDTDDNNGELNSLQQSPSTLNADKHKLKDSEDKGCINVNEKSEKDQLVDTLLQSKPSIPASVRRVNFRNSKSGSVSVPCTPPLTPVPSSSGNKSLSARKAPHSLTRMMSAPVKSRITQKVTGSIEKQVDVDNMDQTPDLTSDELDNDHEENFVPKNDRERNIKSAPSRRKFKSARRKGGRGRDDNSSDEEIAYDEKPRNKKGSSRCTSDRSVDIVTMVSLLSPNESEIEDEPCDPVLQLPSDTPRTCEEKEDPVASSFAKSNSSVETGDLKTAGIFCLRKTPKTVCFQQYGNSPLSRSYTASYPSRRGGGSALLVSLGSEDKELPVPPPISAPHPLVRKKIIKTKSINRDVNNGEEAPDQQTIQENHGISVEIRIPTEIKLSESDKNSVTPDKTENKDKLNDTKDEQNENVQTEPDFKSPKEKECWDLYRKMMTKGVSISYDTVLRGMLTPTEYRQRKTAVLSTC